MLVRTLAKRREFLAANRGLRFPVPGFVLLVRLRDDGDEGLGIGYTVSKKVGNSVVRNRMKRRLRALAREILPEFGVAGADHVLIGRAGGNDLIFSDLGDHLSSALRRANKKVQQQALGNNATSETPSNIRHDPRKKGGNHRPKAQNLSQSQSQISREKG